MGKVICARDGTRHARDVERNLDRLRPSLGFPVTLNHRAQNAHQKGLCQGQLTDADQDEQKDDRHRPMHAGETHFHSGGEKGQSKIANVA